jgi:uncharacterized membrane protein
MTLCVLMRPSQRLLAAFFVFAGAMHFVTPKSYEAIMPPYLPRHREAVVVSGVGEIAGGLMVLHPRTRVLAGTWLVALLAAVFPANVHMAVHPDQVKGLDAKRMPRWALWARLPLQPLMMVWAWRATRPADR